MVGLLSSVDVMLESPMQRVLSKLALNGDIVKSLFVRDGVLGDMLSLAEACETQKDLDFARAFSRLDFTLKQIHTAHIDALVWTDDVLQCV
jgi:EAL and modified HD-GYP domain-containing signal transduction protein